jgi:hypothetical protein
VGLAVIRAIVIIVPFITLFALDEVSFLVPVFKMVVCIFVVDYVVQVSFILISAALLRGSDDAGRVPAGGSGDGQGPDPTSCLHDQGEGQPL